MSNVMQLLDSIEEKVKDTKNDLFGHMLEGDESLSEIETPVLDSLLEDIRDMIEDEKSERQHERETTLYERRMRGDWS